MSLFIESRIEYNCNPIFFFFAVLQEFAENIAMDERPRMPAMKRRLTFFIRRGMKVLGNILIIFHDIREKLLRKVSDLSSGFSLSPAGKISGGDPCYKNIPDGFPVNEGRDQFISLCKKIASVAGKYGVTIVIEPLNKAESNIINSVAEGAETVKEVNSRNFRLLADIFHMMREKTDRPGLIFPS